MTERVWGCLHSMEQKRIRWGSALRGLVLLLLLALILLPCGSARAEEPVPDLSGVSRLYGETRYETAFQAADALKAALGLERFPALVIADGRGYADALSGSPLAVEKRAPILLSSGEDGERLAAWANENLEPGGTIYLLGGPSAVPETVERSMERVPGAQVLRLGGANRYETNLRILNALSGSYETLMVCTGANYADSLSASALGLPILLVSADGLTAEQRDYLDSSAFSGIRVIGGEAAVGSGTEDRLGQVCPTLRLGGTDRYDTGATIAEAFFPEAEAAVLAYGLNFPDGLCGGPLAHALNGPLLLAEDGKTGAAAGYARARAIWMGRVLGGPSLISDAAAAEIFSLPPVYSPIRYELNGGTNDPANPDSYREGQSLKLAPAARDNYRFLGWYREKSFRTLVEEIGPEETGELTLYAKWTLAALEISGEGSTDMIWSWWYHPQVISRGDQLYWCYATSEG